MERSRVPFRGAASAGACLIGLALVSACASPGLERGQTLATIGPADLPVERGVLPQVSDEQVLQQYRAVMRQTHSPEIRASVKRRLAGLEMQRSELQQIASQSPGSYHEKAITLYEVLLRENPQSSDNDRILYQLAKAHDLDGRVEESRALLARLIREYPQSTYLAEAQFRVAEIAFSQQRYAAAEEAYSGVVESPRGSSYSGTARYMRGWARFKQSHYQAALVDFDDVLKTTLQGADSLDKLSRVDRDLVEDTLRVMSLAFSYLDGAESIADRASAGGSGSYQHLLYLGLAKLYLEKERYRDSADTLEHYVANFPRSAHAPDFSVQLIEVYKQGGFPSEILPAKEDFVRRYGLNSSYWSSRDDATQQRLRPYLYEYLQELAQYYHASAQALQAQHLGQARNSAAPGEPPRAESRQAFIEASNWYGEFAETFPADPKTPGMVFLMAESLFEAQHFSAAIAAYERVAYAENSAPGQGAEAGYAAILAYEHYIRELSEERRDEWQMLKIQSALQFAEIYSSDDRAPAVLTRTAEEMLRMGNPEEAVVAASLVTGWQPAVATPLACTAWLVQGQGNFELQNYAGAELAYSGALELMPATDERRRGIVDRLAASIYQQGQVYLARGHGEAATHSWLRVASVAPESSIAQTASYDAANMLMELEDWDRAEQVLQQTRSRYPKHEYAASIAAKLVHVHQQQGNWYAAAEELSAIAATDQDDEVRRKSGFMAAELYQQAGAHRLAIDRYRLYLDTWPVPFAVAMESRYQLALLQQEVGDEAGHRYWLEQIVQSHDTAGADADGRSLYLAAKAATALAENSYRQFLSTPISLPLNASFSLKRRLMQSAIGDAEKVLSYGLGEFVTQANFMLGDIYASLSEELMASPRPPGLDALELEQYEMLLEEQAYPFEEKAIDIHESNARRSWNGNYDQWVDSSIESLSRLLPARYGKSELLARYGNEIF